MAFIKEESEDIRIAEVFSIKHEDTEEQTGWFLSQSWTHSFDPYSVHFYRNEWYFWRMGILIKTNKTQYCYYKIIIG